MFLGIDVFHAPMVFDPKTKKKCRKSSVVAFVFNIIEKAEQGRPIVARTYTRTYRREPGVEFNLKEPLKESVREAVTEMKMLPKSVFVYRDGMNATSSSHELEELEGVRQGLKITPVGGGPAPTVPIAYINCQKRIANKFLTTDGQFAAPPGTLITGVQGMKHKTFYINNSAPKGSTGKPTRFELVKRDAALKDVKIEELTFALCHTYANWTGQIKVSCHIKIDKLTNFSTIFRSTGPWPSAVCSQGRRAGWKYVRCGRIDQRQSVHQHFVLLVSDALTNPWLQLAAVNISCMEGYFA